MSEAFDDNSYVDRRVAPEPRLRFTPDVELESHLKTFLRPGATEAMGRSGLFLYADEPVAIRRSGRTSVPTRSGTESPELLALNRELRERGNRRLALAKRLQPRALSGEASGISLHMDVILQDLTVQALIDHMKVNPDRSVGVHVAITKENMVTRPEYLAACRRLYEALLDDAVGVEAAELVRTDGRIY